MINSITAEPNKPSLSSGHVHQRRLCLLSSSSRPGHVCLPDKDVTILLILKYDSALSVLLTFYYLDPEGFGINSSVP